WRGPTAGGAPGGAGAGRVLRRGWGRGLAPASPRGAFLPGVFRKPWGPAVSNRHGSPGFAYGHATSGSIVRRRSSAYPSDIMPRLGTFAIHGSPWYARRSANASLYVSSIKCADCADHASVGRSNPLRTFNASMKNLPPVPSGHV